MARHSGKTDESPDGKPAAKKYLRWDSKSDAAKLLRSMLENGEIPQDFAPRQIYDMRSEFQDYKLEPFRNGLNNIKSKVGFHLCDNICSK